MATTPDRSRPSVLLVDDTPANLIALRAVLDSIDAELVEARSGEQAIELVNHNWFAAVLLDVQMPNIDGFETAARIRRTERGREVPILFLTAIHRDEHYVLRGYEAGAADYITKPYDAGMMRGRVGAFVDLFRQREAQRRVRFETALELAPALVGILRVPGYTCEFANSECRRALANRELVGRTALELGAAPEVLHLLDEVAVTGQPRCFVEHAYPPHDAGDPNARRFNVTLQALMSADNRVEGILCFAIDVTEQVRARAMIEQARARAEEANRAKDLFLANVSHELRTPLTAILGWTHIAQRTESSPQVERALGVIQRSAQAQVHLIEDILDFAKSGQRFRLSTRSTDLAKTVEAAVHSLRPAADKRGVTLAVDTRDVGIIEADPERLQQVVWNVLSNAIKFSAQGARVEITARREGSRVVIQIVDTGEGIDPAFLPYVFEPYRQADPSTSPRRGGLGLGLSIVKAIVEAHGGSASASSGGRGLGSAFTIELPVTEGPPKVRRPPVLTVDRLTPAEIDAIGLKDLRVLVVDDEQDARLVLQEVFVSSGATVTCSSDALDGLAQVRTVHPDILISDLAMPEVDGYSFIQEVRKLRQEEGGQTPAIALSAYSRTEDVSRALAAGYQLHLAKPVDPVSLLSSVALLARGATS